MAKLEGFGVVEPTDKERGYSEGWHGYHRGRLLNSNQFNPDDEQELYEGFIDGWVSAQTEDSHEDD